MNEKERFAELLAMQPEDVQIFLSSFQTAEMEVENYTSGAGAAVLRAELRNSTVVDGTVEIEYWFRSIRPPAASINYYSKWFGIGIPREEISFRCLAESLAGPLYDVSAREFLASLNLSARTEA